MNSTSEVEKLDDKKKLVYKKKKSSKMERSNWFWAYVMILPLVIGLGIFYIGAFFQNLYYSFTNLGSFGNYEVIGLANYKALMSDPEIPKALMNTFKYTIVSVPLSIAISIFIAVLLNSKIKGQSFYRVLYFLPAVTMPAAIAMIWKWLYNGEYGLLNQILAKFGIQGHAWIANPKFALGALIVVGVWSS